MIDPALFITYVIACVAVVIVPGPSVTVIIANSLRSGTMAGIGNVAGTQAGNMVLLAILAVGLQSLVSYAGEVFFWVKLAGAAYLVWLGIRMWLSDGASVDLVTGQQAENPIPAFWKYFWQGLLVLLANPKALFFFGAFIPQFVDPSRGEPVWQVVFLGMVFTLVALILDGGYAVLAGRAGRLLTRGRVRLVERISGTCLIGGGIWLALTRPATNG